MINTGGIVLITHILILIYYKFIKRRWIPVLSVLTSVAVFFTLLYIRIG